MKNLTPHKRGAQGVPATPLTNDQAILLARCIRDNGIYSIRIPDAYKPAFNSLKRRGLIARAANWKHLYIATDAGRAALEGGAE